VIPRLIGDRCGVLLDTPSAESVAAAVLSLVADEARLAEQGRAARAVSRTYTLERWATTFSDRLTPTLGPLRSAESKPHVTTGT
jgi:hypothetical protein